MEQIVLKCMDIDPTNRYRHAADLVEALRVFIASPVSQNPRRPSEASPLDESEFLESYIPKLVRLAEKNMSRRLLAKVGADDIGATVIRTVIRRARKGKLELSTDPSFWKLLVAITLNKVRKKARYFAAKKRFSDHELPIEDINSIPEPHQVDLNDEVVIEELLDRLQSRLNEMQRSVLAGKIEGLSTLELATKLNVSTKTITRNFIKIQDELRQLGED